MVSIRSDHISNLITFTWDKEIVWMRRVSLTVGLIGRMTVNGAYFICLQYSSEIFPTVIRGQGVGFDFFESVSFSFYCLDCPLWDCGRHCHLPLPDGCLPCQVFPNPPPPYPWPLLSPWRSRHLLPAWDSWTRATSYSQVLEIPEILSMMLNYQRRGGFWKGAE